MKSCMLHDGLQAVNQWLREKDLNITVDIQFNVSSQCNAATKRANVILGYIKEQGCDFYPFIRYWNAAYNATYSTGIQHAVLVLSFKRILKIWRRCRKKNPLIIARIGKMPYSERLWEHDLCSLSERTLRGDLIRVYEYIHGEKMRGF